MKSFLITTGLRTSAAVAIAIGLTAAVTTFAAEDRGQTQLKVITHLDTDKPGRLNERLSGVEVIADCQAGGEPLTSDSATHRTGSDGEVKVRFSKQLPRGKQITCRVTVPTEFRRDEHTYSITPKRRQTIERTFRSGRPGTVRFAYQAK